MPIDEKHCPGCGSAVVQGQPFCPRCGRDITGLWGTADAPPDETMVYGARPTSGSYPEARPASGSFPEARPASGSYPEAPMVQQGSSARPWPFAPEILADRLAVGGFLHKPVVDQVLAEASAAGTPFVARLLERKLMSPEVLRDAMSKIFGLPVADLASVRIDPALISSFPSELARRHMLLPLHREGDRLVMVVADPTQSEAIRAVRRMIGLTIDLRLAALGDLAPVVHQYFSARLVALLPSGETLDLAIPDGEIKIGRADHNDVVLPDPTVGSTHAILRAQGTDYHIVDFGSRNGVFVDGRRINQSQLLKNGDVIQLGQCLLTFKLPLPVAAQSHDGATQLLSPEQVGLPAGGGARVTPVAAGVGAGQAAFQATGGTIAVDDDDKKKKKKKKKGPGGEDAKLKSAWIGFIGRILAQIVGAVATIILGLAVAGKLPTSCGSVGSDVSSVKPPADVELVVPTAFDEKLGGEPHNVSGIVPVGESSFLVVDNNDNEALYELSVDAEGRKSGPLVRRPLDGIGPGQIDDMEALTLAEQNGRRFVIATTSLHRKTSKKQGDYSDKPSGLLRIAVNADGSLTADLLSDFRSWFSQNVKEVGNSDMLEPDEGGLNVEGLAWDPTSGSLIFGVRTPLSRENKPIVVPVRVSDLGGPWDASNLQVQPAVQLEIENAGDRQGVRSIEYDPSRKDFLVVVGNATSLSDAPFQLYRWAGGSSGAVTRVGRVWFDKKMKPEGLTHAEIAGKGAVVFVDDNGGYSVLWDTDARLQ